MATEARLAYQRAWKHAQYARDPAKFRSIRKANRALHKDRINANRRHSHATIPAEVKRDKMLRKKFGISLIEWETLFESQDRACACCHCTEPHGKRWVTDHDHATGAIRGILCNKCNLVLGAIGDGDASTETWLNNFLIYIKKASK